MKIVIEVIIEDVDPLGVMRAAIAVIEQVEGEVGYGAAEIKEIDGMPIVKGRKD